MYCETPMQKRRHFLRLAAVALSGRMALDVSAAEFKRTRTGQRSLVIGAGIAGLAAASELKRMGHEVVVLEARERIGGRICTSRRWNDAPLDLGATWIHGVEDNPITALANKLQLKRIETSYDKSVTYMTSGKLLTDAQQQTFGQLKRQLKQALEQAQQQDNDVSVWQALVPTLNQYNTSSDAYRMLTFILNSEIEQEYSGSAEQLSVQWFDDGQEFDGEDELFVDGFGVIVDHLAQALDIKLGQVVDRIEWGQSPVRVKTRTDVFEADHVVVTLPLGVLKAGHVAFDPQLPADKLRAIRRLGFGVLNKCYLRFQRSFWPDDIDWIEHIPASRGQWAEWVSLKRVLGLPILLGFNAAEQGRALESLSDGKIVAEAMQTLKAIFGNHIPQPVDHQITRWAADPYSLGSYSFNALGSTPAMRVELAAPLADRIFFAGEATDKKYFGTTHGAYLSGLHCAKRIQQIQDRL